MPSGNSCVFFFANIGLFLVDFDGKAMEIRDQTSVLFLATMRNNQSQVIGSSVKRQAFRRHGKIVQQ